MAANGFRGLGWLLSCVVVVLGCYLVTSQVAAERAKLDAVRDSIVRAQKEIRGLETEFDTRANLVQLERWNGDYLALQAPSAPQYVGGETQLASLDRPIVVAPGASGPAGAALRDVIPSATSPAAIAVASSVQTASVAPIARPVRAAIADGKGQVALLDRKLLSDTTLGDLMRSARAETADLH